MCAVSRSMAVAEVDGGGRRVDGAGEAVLDQRRQVAAVIDVGVREHDGVDGARVERQLAIAVFGLLAAALVESAIEKIALAGDFQMMHGTGDRAGRAPECEFHQLVRMMKGSGNVKEGACRRIGVVLVELCRMMNQTQTRKMIRALLFLPALLAAGDQPCDRKLTAAVSRPHAAVNVCISTVRLITATPVLLVEFEFDDIEEHGGLIVVYDLASLRARKKKALFEETSSEGIIPFFLQARRHWPPSPISMAAAGSASRLPASAIPTALCG